MGRFARHGKRLAEYVEALGALEGARLWARIGAAQRGRASTVEVRVPGVPWPVALRPRTSDIHGFEQVFVHRGHAITLDPPPRVIVDAGANVGYASLYFAARWPGVRILAIEPEETTHAVLARNLAPVPGARTLRAGLWPRETRLRIENPQDQPWALRVVEAREGEPGLPTVTMPEVLAQLGVERIDLLKIDIEGAERELFEGGAPWLDRVGAIMIELHDDLRPGASASFFRAALRLRWRQSLRGEHVVLVREA